MSILLTIISLNIIAIVLLAIIINNSLTNNATKLGNVRALNFVGYTLWERMFFYFIASLNFIKLKLYSWLWKLSN